MAYSFYTMSYDDADRWVYMDHYERVATGGETGYEFLYVQLMRICTNIGLSFEQFRYVTAFITLCGLEYASFKFSRNINIVWALYLIYSAMYDSELIRSSLAMSFIAVFLVKLLKAKLIKDYIFSGIWVVISAQFHSSSYIYLLFIPAWYYLRKDHKRSFVIMCLGALAILKGAGSIFTLAIGTISEQNQNYYEDGYHGNLSFNFLMYIHYILPILIFYTSKNNISRGRFQNISIGNNILSLNILFMLILIPHYYVSMCSRLYKILIFFNYIYLAELTEIQKKRVVVTIFGLLYSLSLLIVRLITAPHTLFSIFDMHLSTNLILNILKF